MWDDELLDAPVGDLSTQRVLVVVVPSARDWQIICDEHWYRIPIAHAPPRLAADFLAFYPTAAVNKQHVIRYYAPLLGCHLARRRELLPDEADHPRAEALYWRMELGDLEELPRPIQTGKLRRITFIATTLECLLQATSVTELWERDTHTSALQRAATLRNLEGED